MENRLILDSQLSVSSSKYFTSGAANARLNMNTTADGYGGWIAADDDTDPWLQVDFITEATITAIRVQTADGLFEEIFDIKVSYGNNENSLKDCAENRLARVSCR